MHCEQPTASIQRGAMPGNRMAYAGLIKPEDRAALIQYLRTLR